MINRGNLLLFSKTYSLNSRTNYLISFIRTWLLATSKCDMVAIRLTLGKCLLKILYIEVIQVSTWKYDIKVQYLYDNRNIHFDFFRFLRLRKLWLDLVGCTSAVWPASNVPDVWDLPLSVRVLMLRSTVKVAMRLSLDIGKFLQSLPRVKVCTTPLPTPTSEMLRVL